MRIKDKINFGFEEHVKYGPISIVAFGDSVTHGYLSGGEIDYDTVYWNRLRKKILQIRNYLPVNVINAGIGGITAPPKAAVRWMASQQGPSMICLPHA